VTRLDGRGAVIWSVTIAASANNWAGAFVATDPAGGVWVLGSENKQLPGPQAPMIERPFLTRTDANGHVLWQETIGDLSGYLLPYGVVVEADGHALIGLRLNQGSLSIAGVSYDTTERAIVVRFNPDGTVSWSRSVTGSPYDNLATLAIGSDGTIRTCAGRLYARRTGDEHTRPRLQPRNVARNDYSPRQRQSLVGASIVGVARALPFRSRRNRGLSWQERSAAIPAGERDHIGLRQNDRHADRPPAQPLEAQDQSDLFGEWRTVVVVNDQVFRGQSVYARERHDGTTR
jgi:hypothetical protein